MMDKLKIVNLQQENIKRQQQNKEILDYLSSLKKEYKRDDNSILRKNFSNYEKYKKGITVIVPSYQGQNVIINCLKSLENQTMDKDLFDIIIVLNGESSLTLEVINQFKENHEMNNIYVYESSIANASIARNIALDNANREFILFLDDDDYLSENYLEKMYQYADYDTVVISQIVDVDQNNNKNYDNPINNQIKSVLEKEINAFSDLNMVLTINACKLIPTIKLNNLRYNEALKNGEDIVFFTEFFVKNYMNVYVIPAREQVYYYRLIRDNSVSRKQMSFEFNVNDRLRVIKLLNDLLREMKSYQNEEFDFIISKINAQSSFVKSYLEINSNERKKVFDTIREKQLSYFPYHIINRGQANKLIISYCFPPYIDTSANVMAKRIRNSGEVVDVVYNEMDRVRVKDDNTNILVEDLIEERIEISSYSSFSSWKPINDFCEEGLRKISSEKQYNEVYSRALWPGSHFLAYLFKRLHPNIKWIAEFSDPILYDIHGKERYASIDSKKFLRNVQKITKKRFKLPKVKNDNLFFWCEYLPYLFADELVFTNENQLNYMMDKFPVKKIKNIILEKVKIDRHPTLPEDFYTMYKSNYSLDESKINIAYFGNFYKTRNLNELFEGLDRLEGNVRNNFKLHIFTSKPDELQENIQKYDSRYNIAVNSYVNFLEFLNLTTKFDCLVVNDAVTKDELPINPFLPSKLSDYLGSDKKIWAIYERGSVLSSMDLHYMSELGDVNQVVRVYKEMITDAK